MVYADTQGGFLDMRGSNDSGVVENSYFSAFGCYIIGTFRDKAEIIILYLIHH